MEDDINGQLTGHQFLLPAEIIVEILSRLSVKSLCRFRCVSKPWRSLITNTKFIALHARKALEDKEVFLRRRRVIFNNVNLRGLYSTDLDEFLNHADNQNHDGLVTATELDFFRNEFHADDQKHGPPFVPFIYSCNNLLLCSANCGGLYLVNPATREMKKVARTPLWRPNIRPVILLSLCGFGFDHSNNEYKVVDGKIYYDYIVFSVYRLKTDAWRQIDCHSYNFGSCFQGIFLNGAIHWLAGKAGVPHSRVIATFLLADEEFSEIQLPPIAHTSLAILSVFRDCLCITLRDTDQTFYEFWVMKEYRVNESWTKMVSMPYTTILSHIGFSTKSYDLMVYENSLVMYDFKKESGRKLQIRDMPEVGNCVGVYVEGLFPLIDHAREGQEYVGVEKM